MFEESLLESTGLLRTRSRKPVVTAIAIQAAIAATLLTLPLLHPERLPLRAPTMALTAPPPPAPRPPEPQHVRMVEASGNSAPAAPMQTAAPRIGTQFRPLSEAQSGPAPTRTTIDMGRTGSPFAFESPMGTAVSVAPSAPAHAVGPLRISKGVMAGMLLEPILPIYPAIAKAAHVEGTVVVEAVISATGRIESVHAISGPMMLQPAAVEAVSRARYRPFQLSGSPVEVDTTVTVNFRLGG
jgi:protein TonB